MAIRSSSAVNVSSVSDRLKRAASYQNMADSNGQVVLPLSADARSAGDPTISGKTPDYHLPWTGAQVEETLRKMMNFNPAEAGGVKVLASTSEQPADADSVMDAGNYTANFMTSTKSVWPAELADVSPVNMTVYEKDGGIYQMIESMGDNFTRFTTDNGTTWSVWSPKPIASGGIDDTDPEQPVEDPIEDIKDRLDKVEEDLDTVTEAGLSLGTTEQAEAMLDGKYDWDTGEIVQDQGT